MQGILGQKIGMTAVFDEHGMQLPVSVVRTGGNICVGKRTVETDGYTAVIIGFGEKPVHRVSKPVMGQFEKHDLVTETAAGKRVVKRHVREFRVSPEQLAEYTIGEPISAAVLFKAGERLDVTGTSKGRGFTGVMKRHNFHGTKATHGVHEYFRHGGSIGMNTTPARVIKGKKMPGQHGNKRTTLQNITVVKVLEDEGVVLVRGGIPGPNGGLVMLRRPAKG